MPSPRILFIDHAGVLGGAELYLLDVARHYGDAATVILFEDGPLRERLEDAGVRVRVIPAPEGFLSVGKQSGAWGVLRAVPGFMSLIGKIAIHAQNHDLVFANSQKALVAAGPAAWWANRTFIWNLHDMLTADHFSALNRHLAVNVANAFAHRVIVNSQSTRQAFVDSGGSRKRSRVVYNGLDPTPFDSPDTEQLQELRRDLSVESQPIVGAFSRLAPWKGQHVLIDALPDLPGVHALLVGGALFGDDDSYEDVLREQASNLGIADRVHFLGFRDDVPRLMHLVDVVAHTSTAPEPFGRVIVEGMLAGTPVVGTRAGGAAEIIQDDETGLLVPPGSSDALAAAIQNVLSNPAWARSLSNSARTYARSHFSVEQMLRDIDHVISEALNAA